MTQISLEMPDDLAARLADLARKLGASREDLILRALRNSLDGADALDRWIAEGEADVEAGRVVPFDEAMASVEAIIAAARRANRR